MADRWLTFDCFGTLIDWRHGIRTTGELLFPGRGADFLDAYIKVEAEVETEGSFRRYRAVLTETVRRVAQRLELDLKPDDATALAAVGRWLPGLILSQQPVGHQSLIAEVADDLEIAAKGECIQLK